MDEPSKMKRRKKSNSCKNNMMEDRRPALWGAKKLSAMLLLWVNHPVGDSALSMCCIMILILILMLLWCWSVLEG